jgi:hypothetical protein
MVWSKLFAFVLGEQFLKIREREKAVFKNGNMVKAIMLVQGRLDEILVCQKGL